MIFIPTHDCHISVLKKTKASKNKAEKETKIKHKQKQIQNQSIKLLLEQWDWLIQMHIIKKKRLLLRYIHHFKSDLINDMDHMLISGTEPSINNYHVVIPQIT